jgi:hypothetical protein
VAYQNLLSGAMVVLAAENVIVMLVSVFLVVKVGRSN